jgi:hypothetical protein
VRVGEGGAQGQREAQMVSARSTQNSSQSAPPAQQSVSFSQTQF